MSHNVPARYRLEGEIGRGAMGEVYRAHDELLHRTVVLKFLARDAGDQTSRARFLREARAIAALDHPNICTLFDIGETEDGALFLAMAYYRGETLERHLGRGRPKPYEALRIASQIADGLACAHERGIVHRDVKPANVFLTEDRTVKLLDFGLAQLSHDERVTAEGSTLGTPAYMAPEQARGEAVDARTDLWALGVVLYEMVTGQLPFAGGSAYATIYSILTNDPASLHRTATGLSGPVLDAIAPIVTRALSKQAGERFDDAPAMRAELERALETIVAGAAGPTLRLRSSTLVASEEVAPGVVVLPFRNLSPEPEQDYFTDGVTDTLIVELARLGDLRVISRTSAMLYKNSPKPLPAIGRELGVGFAIEGSAMRHHDRVRLTVQLIDAERDRALWAESYERGLGDILRIQRELARDVIAEISPTLLGATSDTGSSELGPVDPVAFDRYLEGRELWSKRNAADLARAITLFEEAAQIQPEWGLPYAGIADAFNLRVIWGDAAPRDAFPRARAAAERALAADDSLAEAHAALAFVENLFDWDWTGAERRYGRAIALNPSYSSVRLWYSSFLSSMRRHEEAIAQAVRAQQLDPLSLIAGYGLSSAYYYAGRFDEALAHARRMLGLFPFYPPARMLSAMSLVALGQADQAIADAAQATEMAQGAPLLRGLEGAVRAAANDREEAERLQTSLVATAEQQYVPPFILGLIPAAAGALDQAFAHLERSAEERDAFLPTLRVLPLCRAVSDDPRWQAIATAMGLPEA